MYVYIYICRERQRQTEREVSRGSCKNLKTDIIYGMQRHV